MDIIHHVYQALRAHTLFKKDVDYVVKDGEVVIVDEFTGRQMPGRRWSDGLHQAVEAKEGVKIERENQTLATITFQNYFRMYKKLSGMTGNGGNRSGGIRQDLQTGSRGHSHQSHADPQRIFDVVYRTEPEKFEAVVNGILQEDGTHAGGVRQYYERGQPVLVGSISIEKSEKIADLLKKAGIPHQVLNAKQHEREANHRAGGTQGRGHRFHQHGRPRHRHSAGRQSGSHDARLLPEEQAGHALRACQR
jgi:preprotein translocase subunit SecA